MNASTRNALLVIIGYLSGEHRLAMAETARSWLEGAEGHHFIYLDNSKDFDTVDFLSGDLNDSRSICAVSDENLMFAAGVNFAVRQASDHWGPFSSITLLNPDVRVSGDVLCSMVDRLHRDGLGIAAPLVLNESGTLDGGAARRAWTMRRLTGLAAGSQLVARALGDLSVNFERNELRREISEVDATTGACMAVDAEVFGAGLDTRLPMYLEDQEICLRARQMGLRVGVVTSLSATHIGGTSRKQVVDGKRDLRLMELCEAPCVAWLLQGGTVDRARLAILGGAVLRILGAVPVCVAGRKGTGWLREQLTLGRWLAEWALGWQGNTVKEGAP